MDGMMVLREYCKNGQIESVNMDAEGNICFPNGQKFFGKTESRFASNTGKFYKLDTLWFFALTMIPNGAPTWKIYIGNSKARNLDIASILDKKLLISYLTGEVATCERVVETSSSGAVSTLHASTLERRPGVDEPPNKKIRRENLSAVATEERKETGGDYGGIEKMGVENRMEAVNANKIVAQLHDKEILHKSRKDVLLCPGKNFSSFLKLFDEATAKKKDKGKNLPQEKSTRFDAVDQTTLWTEQGLTSRSGSSAIVPTNNNPSETLLTKEIPFKGDPIIIIPTAPNSLVTIYNVKDLLQNGNFVLPIDAKNKLNGAKPVNVFVTHKMTTGKNIKFQIIDNVNLLQKPEDWNRVVAVFAFGKSWQFKGWNGGKFSEPVAIFHHAFGVHLYYKEDGLSAEIKGWKVKSYVVDREHRQNDIVLVNSFWNDFDRHLCSSRPSLINL